MNPTSENSRPRLASTDAESKIPSWLDRVNEVVFHCDADGRMTFVNAAWSRATGYSAEETIGRHFADFVAESDRDLHQVRFFDLLEGRRASLHHELRSRTRDGGDVWLELRAYGETGPDGRVAGVAGTLTDISTRREMEDELRSLAYEAEEARADAESAAQLVRVEAEELARERDQAVAGARASAEFIASMAHDLRTPLNGVLGMTEILLHGGLAGEQREQAITVRTSAESLVRLVDDIVEFSRAGAGQLAVADADFDVRQVVEDVARLLGQKAVAKGLRFTSTVAPSLPERLRGDASHLRQVITNLASNAVRFTDEGSVSVLVSRLPGEQPDGRVPVRIEVHDSDRNTTASKLADMLDRPAGAPTESQGSAGLGLAISRRLVELMSGSISVGSESGRGCWITVELPLARAEAGAPSQAPDHSMTSEPLGLRVLVAEDNVVNQKVVSRLLSRWGINAHVVGDGLAALQELENSDYDVVLMDVRMPVMDGLKATQAVRALEATNGGHTPIVAMTASVLSGDRERCAAAGMDGFVGKPLKAAEIYAELAKWAGREAAPERKAA